MAKSNTVVEEKFINKNEYQISKGNSFVKQMGRGAEGDQNYYTVTRLSQDGTSPNGDPYYKREVILFNNTSDYKAYQAISDTNKGLGANGLGVTIATGSTDPNKKSFEFNDKANEITFLNDKRLNDIKNNSKNQVKDIVKKQNSAVKNGVSDFTNKKKGNTKDDSIDAKKKEADALAKQQALDKKLARGKYGTMFYPSFIQKSNQDKLKITILKPKDPNSSPNKDRKRFISKKVGNQLLPEIGFIDPKKFPDLAHWSNKSGKYTGMIQRDTFQRNQNKIYAAVDASGENINQPEFDKTPIGHITLPIPDGVTDQNKVNFGSGTLNPVQKAVSGSALKFLMGGANEAGKDIASIFKKTATNPDTKKALSNLIAGSATGIDTDELLARTQGSILNNNLALLFKGPALRTFTFQFILSPRDRGEALQVRQIIRAFKQSSAVQRTRGGIFLGAPNTYELKFMKGNTNAHGFLPRIKHCALLSTGVNYMPENSYMTYEDSSMVSYSLSLAFQELTALYNDDYDSDNNTPTEELEDAIFDSDFAGQASSRGIGF